MDSRAMFENRVQEITNGKQRPTSRQETMEVDWDLKVKKNFVNWLYAANITIHFFLVLLIFNGRSQNSSLDSLRMVFPRTDGAAKIFRSYKLSHSKDLILPIRDMHNMSNLNPRLWDRTLRKELIEYDCSRIGIVNEITIDTVNSIIYAFGQNAVLLFHYDNSEPFSEVFIGNEFINRSWLDFQISKDFRYVKKICRECLISRTVVFDLINKRKIKRAINFVPNIYPYKDVYADDFDKISKSKVNKTLGDLSYIDPVNGTFNIFTKEYIDFKKASFKLSQNVERVILNSSVVDVKNLTFLNGNTSLVWEVVSPSPNDTIFENEYYSLIQSDKDKCGNSGLDCKYKRTKLTSITKPSYGDPPTTSDFKNDYIFSLTKNGGYPQYKGHNNFGFFFSDYDMSCIIDIKTNSRIKSINKPPYQEKVISRKFELFKKIPYPILAINTLSNVPLVLIEANDSLFLYDFMKNKKVSKGLFISKYNFDKYYLSKELDLIIAMDFDGLFHIISTNDAKIIYKLKILSKNNSLIQLPNSPYYMCSKDASKMLHYVTPSLKVIGFDQLDPVYNRPDIVLDSIGKYFGGADQELVARYREAWENELIDWDLIKRS